MNKYPPGHKTKKWFGLLPGGIAQFPFVFDDPLFREKWAKPSPDSEHKGSLPLKPAVSKVPPATEPDRLKFSHGLLEFLIFGHFPERTNLRNRTCPDSGRKTKINGCGL